MPIYVAFEMVLVLFHTINEDHLRNMFVSNVFKFDLHNTNSNTKN